MAKTEDELKWTVELHESIEGRQIAFVIDRTNYIEHTVKRILEKYIGAKETLIYPPPRAFRVSTFETMSA